MAKRLITAAYFLTLFTLLFYADGAYALDKNSPDCGGCHKTAVQGAHKSLKCADCHAKSGKGHYEKAADFSNNAKGCLKCHSGYKNMLHSHMAERKSEKTYALKAFGSVDKQFFDKNCKNCHVVSCQSCHGGDDAHKITKPSSDKCLDCHRGYFTGIEYIGLGQREDHERYSRGIEKNGEHYAKMVKDVHAEKGMDCSACHSMKSLAENKKYSKTCTDCHSIKDTSVEHSIKGHSKMECYTCHSSWANQEYGTFWIKLENTDFSNFYRWVKRPNLDYAKSSHTKQYADFPIGINSKGKYSPVRPEFVVFMTVIVKDKVVGKENRMVSADFKAGFPHTVKRETVLCESCHKNNRRLMRADGRERIFQTDKDGLEISNFFNSKGFRVINGRFINDSEYKRIKADSPEYLSKSVKKWEQISRIIKK